MWISKDAFAWIAKKLQFTQTEDPALFIDDLSGQEVRRYPVEGNAGQAVSLAGYRESQARHQERQKFELLIAFLLTPESGYRASGYREKLPELRRVYNEALASGKAAAMKAVINKIKIQNG